MKYLLKSFFFENEFLHSYFFRPKKLFKTNLENKVLNKITYLNKRKLFMNDFFKKIYYVFSLFFCLLINATHCIYIPSCRCILGQAFELFLLFVHLPTHTTSQKKNERKSMYLQCTLIANTPVGLMAPYNLHFYTHTHIHWGQVLDV